MIYCGSWCAGIFDADGFTDYAMFRMPPVEGEGGHGDPGTNFVLVQGHQISAKSQHPEEAVRWLSFLASPEMGKLYAERMQRIPANPTLLGEAQGLTEQFKWMADDVSAVTAQINVLDVLLENSVSEAYLDAGVEVLNGTMTPEAAMESIRAAALEAKARM
jgi:raffinose/stachyose/melibiose transport system substrate-binding protein